MFDDQILQIPTTGNMIETNIKQNNVKQNNVERTGQFKSLLTFAWILIQILSLTKWRISVATNSNRYQKLCNIQTHISKAFKQGAETNRVQTNQSSMDIMK